MSETRLETNATKRNQQAQSNSNNFTNSIIDNHTMNNNCHKSNVAYKNLANLRDILKATHEIRNQSNTQKGLNHAGAIITKNSSQFIRSTNNEHELSKKSSTKLAKNSNLASFESSQIDKDLQESIRLLKEYDCSSNNKSYVRTDCNKLQSNHRLDKNLNENEEICNQSRLSDSFRNLLDLIAEQEENNRTNMDNNKNLLQNNNYKSNTDMEDFMTKQQSNKQKINCDDLSSPMKLLQQQQQQRQEHEITTSLIRNINSEKPINSSKTTTTTTQINAIDQEEKKRNSFNSALLNIEENSSKCDELNETNSCFNRNDLTRKNLMVKWEKENKMLNKSMSIANNANLINKQALKNKEMQSNESSSINEPKVSDSEQQQLFRHSMRQSNRKSTSQIEEKMERVKQSTSFSYEKPDDSLKLKPATWKYDELNELRMKFISLLSSNSNTSSPTRLSTASSSSSSSTSPSSSSCSSALPIESKESQSTLKEQSALSIEAERVVDSEISNEDLSKIESFYRSFGTTLYLSNSSANLYTLPLSQTHLECKSDDMRSKRPQSVSFQTDQVEIDPKILTDFMENKHNPLNTNVYHRGVPLWLFNSGINPRRPNKQLKFTLAERGTGFILWQDRVDNYSDLKFYSMRRKDAKLVDFASYHEKMTLSFDLNDQHRKMSDKEVCSLFSSMLITFKASDKKTRVFIKFDLNAETVKFYEHYVQQFKLVNNEIKQRTKSLPIGVALNTRHCDAKSMKSFTMDTKNSFQASLAISNGRSTLTNKNNNKLRNKLKRQSCHIVNFLKPSQNGTVGVKKITKNDISHPCNPIHVTSIRTNERNSFYTLSKLLPIFDHNVDSLSSSSFMPSPAKSSPSPTCSLTSSACSSTSSPSSAQNSSNLSDSSTEILKELNKPLPILLTSSSCFIDNTQKSTNQSSPTSSSSSSSLSSVPPILFARNSNELQNKQAALLFNNKKPLLSKQKTLR